MSTTPSDSRATPSHSQSLFAVVPKTDCPHVQHCITAVNGSVDLQQPCTECTDSSENWLCLKCHKVFCSRYVREHFLQHASSTRHMLGISFADLSVWCVACEKYVSTAPAAPHHTAALAGAVRAVYTAKFPNPRLRRTQETPQGPDLPPPSDLPAHAPDPSAANAAATAEPPTPLGNPTPGHGEVHAILDTIVRETYNPDRDATDLPLQRILNDAIVTASMHATQPGRPALPCALARLRPVPLEEAQAWTGAGHVCLVCHSAAAVDPKDPAVETPSTAGMDPEGGDREGCGTGGGPEVQYARFPCGHIFHAACAQQWLGHWDVCPLCRQPLVEPPSC